MVRGRDRGGPCRSDTGGIFPFGPRTGVNDPPSSRTELRTVEVGHVGGPGREGPINPEGLRLTGEGMEG